jgi:hypothetical protein
MGLETIASRTGAASPSTKAPTGKTLHSLGFTAPIVRTSLIHIVDRPFSNGGQLMCHEVFIYVEDIIGSTWVSDTPASNFVSGITAPLRGLIL